jgi:curli biogenesis system outer membrane secretion channel CsgG
MRRICITLLVALLASFLTQAEGQVQMPATTAAGKPVLAVMKFQDETGAMAMQGGIGRVVTNMLASELAARSEFTVVERRKLAAVLEEQDLAQSGRLKPGEGAKIGQLTGAQFLVMGTVTAFQPDTETKVSGGGLFGHAKVEQTNHGAYLAVDLRIVDTSTGEVSFARTVEGHTDGSETKIDLAAPDAGYRMMNTQADAKAVRGAILEIIDYLACVMVRKDACVADYAAKDAQRRDGTKKTFRSGGTPR